jgi:hypothetical protein
VSCSLRACATAAQHARTHFVRLPAHRVSRSASCRAACCLLAMHRASASTAARTGAEGALSPPLEKPRGAAMSLHPCLPSTAPHEERAIVGDRRVAVFAVRGRWASRMCVRVTATSAEKHALSFVTRSLITPGLMILDSHADCDSKAPSSNFVLR